MYFSRFPRTTFMNQKIVNLTTIVGLHKLINEKVFTFYNYTIEREERPDHVAFNYYDDVRYAWLVLATNNILDPYWEWPLEGKAFYDWLKKKYGSVSVADSTIMLCEHNTKNITVSADSLADNMTGNDDAGSYTEITAHEYWGKIMENRRHIKLLPKSLLGIVDRQLLKLG